MRRVRGGALAGLCGLVRRPGGSGAVEARHLGDGNIPPGGAVGRRDERVGLDVDDGGHVGCLRLRERLLELGDVAGAEHVGSEAGGVGGQVDREHVAVEAGVGAVAVAGAEPLRAERLRQRADRREAVVLHEHDDQLDALLDGGDELLRHHQVRAVADHDEDVAVVVAHRCRRRPS